MTLTVSLRGPMTAKSKQVFGSITIVMFWQVHNALTRKVKEETVDKLEKAFRESAIVYGLRFKDLNVCSAIM